MAQKKTRRKIRKAESCTKTIVARMKRLGLHKTEFAATIDRLAALYVQLDEIAAEYDAGGRQLIVEHVNKSGAVNEQINPLMDAMLRVQTQALAHERELGLTPAALRKMREGETARPESPLVKAMSELRKG